jgi:hypothetical protein
MKSPCKNQVGFRFYTYYTPDAARIVNAVWCITININGCMVYNHKHKP